MKNIVVFLPLLILLVLVNYLADPAQILKKNYYEQGIAEILLKGSNAANISNYDERLFQKHYISGLTEKRDVIVLGSSRAMQIGSTFFPNNNFFNHGVSGASIEDFMAIFEMYQERHMEPGVVILGLDPWILNKNSGQERWRSVADYYERFVSRLGMEGKTSDNIFSLETKELFRIKKYLQIISVTYFQSSIRYLQAQAMLKEDRRSKYYPTNLTESDVHIKLFDGSFSYKDEHRLMSAAEVLKRAQQAVERDSIYSLGGFYELDKELIFKFEKFVEILLKKGIKVVFFLPSYHPYIYNYLIDSGKYKIVLKVESYFREVASRNNIQVIGSYDPGACGLGNGDFYDARHLKRKIIARLIKECNAVNNKSVQE